MRTLKAWACAVAVAATAAPALGQLTGGAPAPSAGTGSTGTRSTATGSMTNTGTGGIAGGSSAAGFGSNSPSGSAGSTLNTLDPALSGLNTIQPQNLQFSNIGITASGRLQPSNAFGRFYSNPFALGLSTTGGGFGQPAYGATAGATTGATGAAGSRTGAAGLGGRNAGLNNAANQSGILIPLPVQINYAAELRFAAPPVAATRLQADLRGVVDTGGLTNAAGVQVVTDATNNVTLRGAVRDDDERRLVEGLVRLTPGVRNIVNELTYPGK